MKSKRLLNVLNDVDEKYIEEANTMNKSTNVKKSVFKKWGALAACLAVFAVSAVALPSLLSNNSVVPIERVAAPADSPNGMRKFMNYNNYRYAFLENGAVYGLVTDQLGPKLGTIEHDIQIDPQANATKDLAASFAIGGTIYQLSTYDPLFRLAVELDGAYYICERVDTVDGAELDIAEYFKLALFPESIEEIAINDHAGANVLKMLEDNKVSTFVERLSAVVPASLTGDDYAKISAAQKSGDSYLVSFGLKDSTQYNLYVIPTLSIAMIGDNKYTLSDEFMSEFGGLFDGLVQKPAPQH